MTGCPGRDRSSWTADDIFETACPSCGAMVEFFKDDARRDCPSCGGCMVNPKRALSCADWCSAADKCSLFRHAVAHAAPAPAPEPSAAPSATAGAPAPEPSAAVKSPAPGPSEPS